MHFKMLELIASYVNKNWKLQCIQKREERNISLHVVYFGDLII